MQSALMASEKFPFKSQKLVNEQKVLDAELRSLKKTNAKVYRQQQNSDIFFLSSRVEEMKRCKKTLEDLQREYKQAEKPS